MSQVFVFDVLLPAGSEGREAIQGEVVSVSLSSGATVGGRGLATASTERIAHRAAA